MAISEQHASSNDVGEFTETVEFAVLSCGNIEKNNNKYYCLELQKSSSGQYRLFCTRGRIGSSTVYGVRGPIGDQFVAKKEFDKIVSSKLKGKSGGEVSKYALVETLKPTIGSKNICNQTTTKVSIPKPDIKDKIKSFFKDKEAKIVQQLYNENIHQIQMMTSISVTSNGLETALGPVTPNHVTNAKQILEKLKSLQESNCLIVSNTEAVDLNNQYLSMIPRKVEGKIKKEDMILTDRRLIEEFDLLDQLSSAIQINTNTKDDARDFGFRLTKNDKSFKEIQDWFEKTRASNHFNLKPWKVYSVYDIENEVDKNRFENCQIKGKIERLWHGSQNSNVLSILMNGLIIPGHNAPHVTGRMFGNGVYGASNSTKALNYSVGYWSGKSTDKNNTFLLEVQFKMGNVYYPTSSLYNGPPKGYDSVHAIKSKCNLYNDEFIVYSLPQQRIVRLIELRKDR